MVERIILVVLLLFFFHLAALMVVPDPSKPTMNTSLLLGLIDTADQYLYPVHKSGRWSGGGLAVWENSLAQLIREEIVLPRLSEIALSEELKPPLPRVSLFPTEKLDENEQQRILEGSRFYRELEGIIQEGEREGGVSDVPGPQTSDAKGGTIPLPEDTEAARIIAHLKEAAQKEGEEKKAIEAAALGIRGPAANRTISYLPPPLQEKVSVDDEALLKFWILPDGSVGRVIPFVKGDAQATTVVINHFKKYRFNPLPSDVPQVEIWGTIPVKSVLQ
jgi:hypothetical protein